MVVHEGGNEIGLKASVKQNSIVGPSSVVRGVVLRQDPRLRRASRVLALHRAGALDHTATRSLRIFTLLSRLSSYFLQETHLTGQGTWSIGRNRPGSWSRAPYWIGRTLVFRCQYSCHLQKWTEGVAAVGGWREKKARTNIGQTSEYKERSSREGSS